MRMRMIYEDSVLYYKFSKSEEAKEVIRREILKGTKMSVYCELLNEEIRNLLPIRKRFQAGRDPKKYEKREKDPFRNHLLVHQKLYLLCNLLLVQQKSHQNHLLRQKNNF